MKVIVNEIDILSGKNQFDNLNAMFEFIGRVTLPLRYLNMLITIYRRGACKQY